MTTTVDREGHVNAAAYATCVRIVHKPVQIAFTTSQTGDTGRNTKETGQFVVNLPSFERDVLEKARIAGLPFARGVNEREKAGLPRWRPRWWRRRAFSSAIATSNARWCGPRNGSTG